MSAPAHRADVFLDPADDPREGGVTLGDERATLVEFLRFQRLTLQVKCDGLDADQLAQRDWGAAAVDAGEVERGVAGTPTDGPMHRLRAPAPRIDGSRCGSAHWIGPSALSRGVTSYRQKRRAPGAAAVGEVATCGGRVRERERSG